MKHPELTDLQDYFENAFPLAKANRVKAHAEECDHCTGILADFALVENKVRNISAPVVSQQVQARIFLEAAEILKKKREYELSKKDFMLFVQDWRENIMPEIRIPALQLASVSIMLTTFIMFEKMQSTHETVFEPISNEVKVYEGEDKV